LLAEKLMEPSDEALIQACRNGDELAWDQLVARYERLIFTIARHAGLEAEQADDVLQRVFLILLERLETITQPARLSAWLTATTRREAWRMRRRERMAGLHGDEIEEELAGLEDDGELPDDLVLRLEEQQDVLLAMEGLDERCRTLLTLLFLSPDSPSYAELAVTLGMREGAIGPTRARCLEKLRRLLES
jgi:RNA polymerase sigma factor (sigma-70 family)